VLVTVEDGELSFVVTAGNGPSLLPPPGEADGDEGEGDREPQVPEPA